MRAVDGPVSASSSVLGALVVGWADSWPAGIAVTVAIMGAYLALIQPRVRSWETKRRREYDEATDGRLTTRH